MAGAHHEGGSGGNGGNGGSGESGGDVGIFGAAGAMPPACMPSPEICNDVDDDCDGVVDPGCPGGIKTTFERDMQLLGDSSAGQAFTDDCKDGELLTGVSVAMGEYLAQISGLCRSLSLQQSPNADHGYKVTLQAERTLGAHPPSGSSKPVRLACPEDEAVVGMRLAQQNFAPADGPSGPVTTRIWITCAKLMLSATTDQSQLVWAGAKEQAPLSGSIANQTAWFVQASAPDKLVASRLIGSSSERVERVSFGVSRLNLLTR
jgi:hypothetical protein